MCSRYDLHTLVNTQTHTYIHTRRVQMAAKDTPVWGPRHFVTFLVNERHLKIILLVYLLTYTQTYRETVFD